MAAKKSAGSRTPATTTLDRLGLPYTPHEYTHDPAVDDYGREAAEALSMPPAQVFKTLLAEVDGQLVVGIVPVNGKLDLKALARAVGGKKAVMANPLLAERKTGYIVGGISPIGQKTSSPTFLDSTAAEHVNVLVSGGRRGLDIEIAVTDLLRATGGILAPIRRTD
ncbi:Cys-tRNA(Pro) deacylase [Klugiella xanthotipulae]|uniref:Cys-tRNA(Pro)/Cys-tRNA(Cys) deacylase n=1 Tax=Klugiella xanthotipulae TaxID=244735 RepID=A0A543HS15_9MICO|nr:Cys-tRNA(Pro) deacylase [Klugiella xanthotipulae]TQM61131.1 Cys-tRNA(Pro)/Cys-tRNA(Cys) deacylase [Klugiella xanthotipulae]